LERRSWKRFAPNPYRWHIRRVATGRVLDVGCGIGRCLAYLAPRAIGVDPNATAVALANARGLTAFTPDTFPSAETKAFDTLLCSHVLEHLEAVEAADLLRRWLPLVRSGGRVVLICPQERGQASDVTHVRLMDPVALRELCDDVGIEVERIRSFPLPARFGRWWTHNETVVIGRRP
jgi:2-polyprenyl-3-methyl-5-hydroxy-6-metoxy-1,4-benzoquinol methylase